MGRAHEERTTRTRTPLLKSSLKARAAFVFTRLSFASQEMKQVSLGFQFLQNEMKLENLPYSNRTEREENAMHLVSPCISMETVTN